MAGLTSTQINNKLASEGTTAATQQLILNFLNSAASAGAIAGSEPQEGPVVCVSEISAIRFNFHTAAFTNDALNTRRNSTTTAPSPEWQKGVTVNYADSPVAYTVKET